MEKMRKMKEHTLSIATCIGTAMSNEGYLQASVMPCPHATVLLNWIAYSKTPPVQFKNKYLFSYQEGVSISQERKE